jgi:hypothetical protein
MDDIVSSPKLTAGPGDELLSDGKSYLP